MYLHKVLKMKFGWRTSFYGENELYIHLKIVAKVAKYYVINPLNIEFPQYIPSPAVELMLLSGRNQIKPNRTNSSLEYNKKRRQSGSGQMDTRTNTYNHFVIS